VPQSCRVVLPLEIICADTHNFRRSTDARPSDLAFTVLISMAKSAYLPFPGDPEPDPSAQRWPGREDDFVVAPDLLPARIVKAHNVHKKFYRELHRDRGQGDEG
jgi:hypothetical protein